MILLLALVLLAADPWKGDEYAKNSASQKESANDFMKDMHLVGDESILDVGCGDGKITAAMAKAVTGDVIGVDISPSMIGFAEKAFPHVTFQVQDAAKLNFENKFDLITSFTVMQWVLDQEGALKGFAKALKPEGRLWIQMPTGLPSAMTQALEKTVAKWSSFFKDFSPPWRFYNATEYRKLLTDTHFTPTRLDVVAKHEKFPSRAAFQGFLRQWFPYLRPLPEDKKDAFLTELLDNYLQLLPVDDQGRVSFIVDRLEVEATKS